MPVGLGIGVLGAQLVKGVVQSKAAKKAAGVQTAAAEDVKNINRGVYQQQMQGMEPYAALGRSSANTLGRLMSPGVGYSPQTQLADTRALQQARPPWSMDPTARAAPGQAPPPGMAAGVVLRGPDGSMRRFADEASAAPFLNRQGVQRVQ